MKSGLREIVALSVAMAVVGCTNDYGDFELGPGLEGDSAAGVIRRDSGSDRSATGTGGDEPNETEDAGDAPVDIGADEGVDASDAGAEADASSDARVDAPADAPIDAPLDAPGDSTGDGRVDAPADAPVDSRGDVIDAAADATSDASTDAAQVGSDASDSSSEADASTANGDAGDAPSDVSIAADAADAELEAEAAPSCGAGTKLCGTGCVNVTDPATGCAGVSCAPCALSHASATCDVTGECAVLVCAAGYDDCDTIAANGCESLLASDALNCGACGRPCAGDSVLSKECAGGLCVSTCSIGHSNCSAPFSGTDDGCEVASDNAHCGSCRNDCTMQGSGFTCNVVANQCGCTTDNDCRVMGSMGTCDVGTGRCTCGGTTCQSGEACQKASGLDPDTCSCNGGNACSANLTCCQFPSSCRNLQADPGNCGACGHRCPSGFFCSAGECGCGADLECNAGSPGTCAAGQCVCGAITCPKGQRCQPGGTCG